MTDYDPKKTLPHPRNFFSHAARAFVSVPETAASDPFEDDGLDAFLEDRLEKDGTEPKLLIVDRLLNRVRFRREC